MTSWIIIIRPGFEWDSYQTGQREKEGKGGNLEQVHHKFTTFDHGVPYHMPSIENTILLYADHGKIDNLA